MKPSSSKNRAAAAIVLLTIFVVVGFALDDPRRRFVPFACAMLGAGAAWVALIGALRRPTSQTVVIVGVAVGAALRIWGLDLAPAFSDDVFRYVYEGRVVWREGLGFPFAHAPAEAPALGVAPELLDRTWLRINHPELATIYPPFSQAVFAIAGGLADALGGDPLTWLKAALVVADVATAWILYRCGGLRAGLGWWLCPIVIVEIAREGHADGLSALGLALVVAGFVGRAPLRGFTGAVVAALAKLNGLFILPAALRATRRGVWVLAFLALLALPYLLAGHHASEGIGAYASRWRSGDGLFSVFLEVAGGILGGEWRRVGEWVITQHQLARAISGVVFVTVVGWSLRRRPGLDEVPARGAVALLTLLLVAPTFHPWYVTWLLPFALAAPHFRARPAVLYLAVTSPLLHHPGWLELVDGVWSELVILKWAVHGPALLWLFGDLVWGAVLGYPPSRATGGGAADRGEGRRGGADREPSGSPP